MLEWDMQPTIYDMGLFEAGYQNLTKRIPQGSVSRFEPFKNFVGMSGHPGDNLQGSIRKQP